MMETLAYVEGLFNALASALERAVGLFRWADERISGGLLLLALVGAAAPLAIPLFCQGVAGLMLLVAMFPPTGAVPVVDFPGRVENVLNRIPTRAERVL